MSIELATCERFAALESEWRDLVRRAAVTNAFLEPALVCAAAACSGRAIHVLLAWEAASCCADARLLGAWAFLVCRPSSGLPIPVLTSPVHDHAALGTPVIDGAFLLPVLDRFLKAIRDAPDLPKIVELHAVHRAGPMGKALQMACHALDIRVFHLDPRRRPCLDAAAPAVPMSRSRAKALRQKRRRLAEEGAVCLSQSTRPDDVAADLEAFLALEAAGWKGRGTRRGQAILRTPNLAAFFRAAVPALSASGLASISTLSVAGRPVALQLVLTSGRTAFTWKTAYDETRRACGPGLLLLEDVTASFQASRTLDLADSCNHRDDGYMAEFWSGRVDVGDAVFDVRPGRSPALCLVAGGALMQWRLKSLARALKARWLPRLRHIWLRAAKIGRAKAAGREMPVP